MNEQPENFELNKSDSDKLDQFFVARAQGEELSGGANGVDGVLGLLNQYPEATLPSDLIQRTLGRVETLRDHNAVGEDIEAEANRFRLFNWQLRDIAGVAAILLVGASLMIPMLNQYSRDQRRSSDMANLGQAGGGFASYAMDHQYQLPRQAGLGQRWDMVGKDHKQSNSANLYKLVKDGYVGLSTLSSADNENAPLVLDADAKDWKNYDQVSFSYINQFGKKPINLASVNKPMVVLANKNPYFIQKDGKLIFRMTDKPTKHYGDKGQLMLMFRGNVQWGKRCKTQKW